MKHLQDRKMIYFVASFCKKNEINQLKEYFNTKKYTQEQLDYALMFACEYNRYDIIEYLLTSPNLNSKIFNDQDSYQALYTIVRQNNVEMMDFLLKFIEPSKVNQVINFILGQAFDGGKTNMINSIINHPLSQNNPIIQNQALINACYKNNLDIVELLLKKGQCDIGYRNNYILKLTLKKGNLNLLKIITNPDINSPVDILLEKNQVLPKVIFNKHLHILKYFLDNGIIDEQEIIKQISTDKTCSDWINNYQQIKTEQQLLQKQLEHTHTRKTQVL